jgi:hypothetical protein
MNQTTSYAIIAEQGGESRPLVARELARLERLDRGTPRRRKALP